MKREFHESVTFRKFVVPSSSDSDISSDLSDHTTSDLDEAQMSYDDSTASDSQEEQEATATQEDEEEEKEEEHKEQAPDDNFGKKLPVRRVIDGFICVRRKVTDKCEYWYCTNRECKAGYIYIIGDNVWKSNGKPHSHSSGNADIVRKENEEEFLLRKFVLSNRNLEAHEIYALLLERHTSGVEQFAHIGQIDIKRIQNIKEQFAGEASRNALESILPPELSAVDGKQSLVFQAVKPVILIFATEVLMKSVRTANVCVLLKLPVAGPVLEHVYCIYTMSKGSVLPAMWVMFGSDSGVIPWAQVRQLLDKKFPGEERPLTRLWIIPCSNKYLQILENISRRSDTISGIDASFTRKITKICATIQDQTERSKVHLFFSRLANGTPWAIESAIGEAKRHWTDPAGTNALAKWNRSFDRQIFMYPATVRCHDAVVAKLYEDSLAPKITYQTDREVIEAALQKMQESNQIKTSGSS